MFQQLRLEDFSAVNIQILGAEDTYGANAHRTVTDMWTGLYVGFFATLQVGMWLWYGFVRPSIPQFWNCLRLVSTGLLCGSLVSVILTSRSGSALSLFQASELPSLLPFCSSFDTDAPFRPPVLH